MAVVAVAFDGARLTDASTTVGWTADSAAPTLEVDFFYQGTTSISGLVKTAEIGFYFTSASTSMSSPPRTALLKVTATNKDAMDGIGMAVRIGSGIGAYHQYNIFTATTYPIPGGFQIVPIDPNVGPWRTSTTGTPDLGAVVYWAIRADFSTTAKSQNLGMDAIDYIPNGGGLTLTGGDGADADGTFTSFVTSDEGTAANRWGVIATRDGIVYVNGVLTIGTATATVFTDSNRVVVFPDHRVATGFCGVDFGLQNASSVIAITNTVFNGRGALYVGGDTRPDYTVVGTSGSLSIGGSTFNTYRRIDLTTAATLSNCIFIAGGDRIDPKGGSLAGSEVSGYAGSKFSAAVLWDRNLDTGTLLADMVFTASSVGHAIELGPDVPILLDFNNITFTGYGGNGTSTAAVFNNTGKAITIAVTNFGDTPTYRNAYTEETIPSAPPGTAEWATGFGTGWEPSNMELFSSSKSHTRIQNAVTLQLTNVVVGSNCAIIADAGGPEPVGAILMNEAAVSSTVSEPYNYLGDQPIIIRVRRSTLGSTRYFPISSSGLIESTGFSLRIEQVEDTIAAPT